MAYFSDKTIIPSSIGGGDYATVTAWYASVEDATPSGDGCIGRMRGKSDDTGQCTISPSVSGWSTTCRMILTAGAGYGISDRGSSWTGADGSGDDAVMPYRLLFTGGTNYFIEVCNIEIGQSSVANVGIGFNPGTTLSFTAYLWNLFIHDSTQAQIYVSCSTSGTVTFYLANLLLQGWTNNYQRAIVTINDGGGTFTGYARQITMDGLNGVYNGHDCVADFDDIIELRNAVGFQCNGNVIENCTDEDYCADDDGTCAGSNSINSITLANNFTNLASHDYSIKDTDADIYHSGYTTAPSWFTDLVGTGANGKGVDIRGVDYASTPSMGCFEYAASSPPAAPTNLQWDYH